MPNDRPKVGPADPETRRKKLREELDKPTRGEGVAPREEQKPRKKRKATTLSDLLDPNMARERTARGENTSLSEAVDEGVRQGTEAEKKRK